MRNAGLEEAQTGIKTARRNINNLRNADDTTLMAESEELKSLLMKVKVESEKAGLKFNIQKTKYMASDAVTSWQIDGEAVETVRVFILEGSKITADGDYSYGIKRRLLHETLKFESTFSLSYFTFIKRLFSTSLSAIWERDGETVETVSDFILGGSKITADCDCSHEIKRHLLLGRKVMTNLSSLEFSSVTPSCPTFCDPMNRSTPGLPVHHQLPEFTQTHIHRVSDAIQPSHPGSSPSSPAHNPSQHQSLFQ